MTETVTTDRQTYRLLDHDAYISGLLDAAANAGAGDRLTITTMAFDVDRDHPETQALADELVGAAERKAEVRFGIDAFAFLISPNDWPTGPLLTGFENDRTRRLRATIPRLVDAGVAFSVLNMPPESSLWINPFAGRSHIKASVMNDTVTLGSANLNRSGRTHDTMVSFQHGPASDWLNNKLGAIIARGSVQAALGTEDCSFAVDDAADLLIDVGVRRQSTILDTAEKIARRSKGWTLCCGQYFPIGSLARYLGEVKQQGREAVLLYNHDPAVNLSFRIQALLQRLDRLSSPTELTEHGIPPGQEKYFHAKGIATPGEALVGTSDLTERFVRLGTAEIALHVRDPGFSTAFARTVLGYANQEDALRI